MGRRGGVQDLGSGIWGSKNVGSGILGVNNHVGSRIWWVKKSGIWDIGGEKIWDLGYGDPCKPGESFCTCVNSLC